MKPSILEFGILSSRVKGCPITLAGDPLSLGLPMAFNSKHGSFSASAGEGGFYAGSRSAFDTAHPKWTSPRVIQARLLQLDAGVAAFRIESDTHYLEAWFDSVSGAWTSIVDGVVGSMVNGFFDDVVTFRISGDVAEVKVNDTVMATSAGLFQGEPVRLLMSWDTTGAVDGDAIAGQVIGGVFGDAIGYANEGDADWCGNIFHIASLEEPAGSQLIDVTGDASFLQRHALIEFFEEGVDEAPGSQTITSTGDVTFLQRHQETS
ncbi:MAG: hypothetical protein ACPH5V_09145 [Alcanivorax sp.]